MTIQIKDLTVSQEIDMTAVRGAYRLAEGDAGSSGTGVPYNAYVNDVIMGAVAQGPVAIVAAAAHIPL